MAMITTKKYFEDFSLNTVHFGSNKVASQLTERKYKNVKIIRIQREGKAEHLTFIVTYLNQISILIVYMAIKL